MQRISWWNKTLNYFEDFKQKYRFKISFLGLVSIFLIFWLIHEAKLKLSLNLPETINIPNFIGNVDSVFLALLGGFILGLILTRSTLLERLNILRLSVLFGTLVGLAQNILIETKFGMDLLGQPNISDPLDVIWGTTFCLVACLICFKVKEV
ncbi:MAG: hypothetical protein QG623_515 [Patescibacteria group bacterium]|nr:hypothetical protein [Patescibacteria group bacterium]